MWTPNQFFRGHWSIDDVTKHTVPVAELGPHSHLGLNVTYQFFLYKVVSFMLEMFSKRGNYRTQQSHDALVWWLSLSFLLPALPLAALNHSLGQPDSHQWLEERCLLVSSSIRGRTPPSFLILGHIHTMETLVLESLCPNHSQRLGMISICLVQYLSLGEDLHILWVEIWWFPCFFQYDLWVFLFLLFQTVHCVVQASINWMM